MAVANLVLRVTGQMADLEKDLQKTNVLLGEFGKQFQTTSAKATKAQAELNAAFSGEKIITQAAGIVTAVDKIGGATKLTATEQERVNRTLTEAIAKYGVLGQQAPAAMTALAQATAQVEKRSGFFADLGDQVKASTLGFISAQAVIGAVSTAFHSLTGFLGSSIESYAKAEAAAKKMTTALIAQGTSTPGVVGHMQDLAAQFQRTTVYSDDLINEMEALFIQIGNVGPAEMGKALTAATDLASGLGVDLQTATTLVGKAFAGETGTLKRYGIVIDETKLKTEGVTAVLDAIQSKFGGQAAAEIDTYAGRVKQLANEWDNFKEAVGETIVTSPLLVAGLRLIQERITGSTGGVKDHDHAWSELLRSLNIYGKEAPNIVADAVRHYEDLAVASNQVASAQRFMADMMDPATQKTKIAGELAADAAQKIVAAQRAQAEADRLAADAAKKAKEAAEAHAKAITALADSLTHKDLTKKAADLAEALQSIGKAQRTPELLKDVAAQAADLFLKGGKLSPVLFDLALHMAQLNLKVVDGIEGLGNLGSKVDLAVPKVSALAAATEDLTGKIKLGADGLSNLGFKVETGFEGFAKAKEAKDHVDDLARSLSQLAQVSGGAFASIVRDIANVVVAFDLAVKSVKAFKDAKTSADKALALASGGAAVLQATGTGSTASRTIGGAATGAALGSAFGPVGTAIGAVAGGTTGLLRGLFSAQHAGRDLVKTFAASLGGFDALHLKLQVLGADGERLWQTLSGVGKNNSSQAQAAIDQVSTALSHSTDNINTMIHAALTGGPKIPAAFQPFIDQLVRTGQLTEQNANLLLGLPENGIPSFASVKDAADRYGLSLDALGPKVDQLQITSKADQIVRDWNLLADAGADTGAVMAGMTDEVQPLVDSALRFGRELPSSMRDMLEQMAAAGDLTDITGGKLKDLSGIHFVEPLTNKIDDLITKLGELIDKIAGPNSSVGAALDQLGRSTFRPRIAPVLDDSDLPTGHGAPRFARGGIVTHPTLALVGERGPEAIVPLSGNQLGMGAVHVSTTITLDGKVVARNTARHLPDVFHTYGAA